MHEIHRLLLRLLMRIIFIALINEAIILTRHYTGYLRHFLRGLRQCQVCIRVINLLEATLHHQLPCLLHLRIGQLLPLPDDLGPYGLQPLVLARDLVQGGGGAFAAGAGTFLGAHGARDLLRGARLNLGSILAIFRGHLRPHQHTRHPRLVLQPTSFLRGLQYLQEGLAAGYALRQ